MKLNIMNPKTKQKKHLVEESIEAKPRTNRYVEPTTVKNEMKQLWDSMIANTKQDVFGDLASDINQQIFGGGDLQPGHEVSLARQAKKQEQPAEQKPQVTMEHMEYFRSVQNVDRLGETRTETQISRAVEEIRMEIKKLVSTSKIVERTVKDAAAEKAPVKPGKYHLNFFEFVLNILKDATQKLEDSATLGAVFTSKKQQSKYWNTYKKQGTSFGLSGERTTATQTG